MKLKAGLLVLIFVLTGSFALAQDPSSPFLPFYFIEGQIDTEIGTGLIDHNVVLFESDPRVLGVNENFSGPEPVSYRINAFDSQYYGRFNLNAGSTYQIGVPTGIDGYGMDPTPIVLSGNGFDQVDLTLVLGGGGGILPPDGTVPLNIERDGGNVRVTWDNAAYPSVDLWRVTGDGTGQFTNGPGGWATVLTADGSGSYPDSGAFASGDREIYYKGIINGRPDSRVTVAWAVGKFDLDLTAGYNLVSLPMLSLNGTSVDEVFSNQLHIDDVEVFVRNDATGLYTSKAQVIGGSWTNILGPDPALGLGSSYWIGVPSTIRVSLLGAVASSAYVRPMYSAAGGYNMFGWPFPYATDLVTGGLATRGEDEIFINLAGEYEKVINSGGAWSNTIPTSSAFGFVPGAGFWYHNNTTDFDWTAPVAP